MGADGEGGKGEKGESSARAELGRAAEWARWKELFKKGLRWLRGWADITVSRNQVFYSQESWIWAMLIGLGGLGTGRVSWELASLLVTKGPAVLLTLSWSSFFLVLSMTQTEVMGAMFTGTGVVSYTWNLSPLLSGIGGGCVVHGFYTLVRGLADLSLISAHALRLPHLQNQTTSEKKDLCDAREMNWFQVEKPRLCVSLVQMVGPSCRNPPTESCLPAFSDAALSFYLQEESSNLADKVLLAGIVLVIVLSVLSLLKVARVARLLKFLALPVLLHYCLLAYAGIAVRGRLKEKNLDGWADLKWMFQLSRVWEGLRDPTVWTRGPALAVQMLGGAGLVAAGLARRTAQGIHPTPSLLLVSSVALVSNVLAALVYMVASPGAVPRLIQPASCADSVVKESGLDKWPLGSLQYLYPWAWLLSAGEAVQLQLKMAYMLVWAVPVVLGTVRLFLEVDCLRSAVMELRDVGGWDAEDEEGGEAWRRRLGPLLLLPALLFPFSVLRFWTPDGAVAEELLRSSAKEHISRLVMIALHHLLFHFVYGEKRLSKDDHLVTGFRGYSVSGVYRRFRFAMNKLGLPVLLGMMLYMTGAHWTEVSDGWGAGREPTERRWESPRHRTAEWKAWNEWGPWVEAGGWLYATLPLLVVLASALRTVYRLRQRGQLSLPTLLRPRTQWGPSEIRFWEGRYKHLFYDHGIILDEEKDLQRIVLRMGKRRLQSHASRALPPPAKAKAKAPTAPTPSPSATAPTAVSAPTPKPSKEPTASSNSKDNDKKNK